MSAPRPKTMPGITLAALEQKIAQYTQSRVHWMEKQVRATRDLEDAERRTSAALAALDEARRAMTLCEGMIAALVALRVQRDDLEAGPDEP